jgi:hypothetical protein
MIFTAEMREWLSKNVPGKTYKEITALFNARFNTGFTSKQIDKCCYYCGFKTGRYVRRKVGMEAVVNKTSSIIVHCTNKYHVFRRIVR